MDWSFRRRHKEEERRRGGGSLFDRDLAKVEEEEDSPKGRDLLGMFVTNIQFWSTSS